MIASNSTDICAPQISNMLLQYKFGMNPVVRWRHGSLDPVLQAGSVYQASVFHGCMAEHAKCHAYMRVLRVASCLDFTYCIKHNMICVDVFVQWLCSIDSTHGVAPDMVQQLVRSFEDRISQQLRSHELFIDNYTVLYDSHLCLIEKITAAEALLVSGGSNKRKR